MKRIMIVLLLCLVLTSISCSPLGQSGSVAATQTVEVVSGNLTVIVSGSGDVELVKEQKLAFGAAGKIERIYVKEQEKVSEGQVLAKLETDALEYALAQAQVAYAQAQASVIQAQIAVKQAEITLESAKIARFQSTKFQWPEVEVAQADVDKAKYSVQYAYDRLKEATTDADKANWSRLVIVAEDDLVKAEDRLNVILSGTPVDELVIKRLQVEVAEQSLELAKQSLELAIKSPEVARQSLELAQKHLDEATITAPFDGIVASVPVKERDVILSSATTIIHLIDPSSMQLKIEVDEIDISLVKAGQRAIIEIDALSALQLEGKVSSISLLPTKKTGTTVYDVKISFDIADDSGLRDGMSATADIVVAERTNALLVPDRAINEDTPGKPTVEVMVNGQIEERAVVTGISDGFQTEIVDGLEEGEMVVEKLPRTTSSASGLF